MVDDLPHVVGRGMIGIEGSLFGDKGLNVKFPGRLIHKESCGVTSLILAEGELHAPLKCRFGCRVRFDLQVKLITKREAAQPIR